MYRYRRQIRLLLLLLIVLAGAYGGIKAWLYLNVQRAIEEVSVKSAGRVEIRYQAIDTALAGSVTLHGMELHVAGAPVPLRIRSARLSGPPLSFFLLGQKQDDPPPPRMQLDIEDLRIDLNAALFDSVKLHLGNEGRATGRGCGAGDELDPEILRELGFEHLEVDARMAYDYDSARRSLDGSVDFDVARIERLHATVGLDNVAPDAFRGGAPSLPSLADMAVEVRVEPAFGRKYLNACAERQQQTPEAYRDRLVRETLAELARGGLQLGPGLRAALEEFHRDWGEFQIGIAPPQPLNPLALMFNPPADWQETLGLRVELNQRPIADLSFELRPSNAEELAAMLGQDVPSTPRIKAPRFHYVYRTVAVAALGDHLGAEAKLHLRDGQPMRSGTLVAVTGGEVRVEQRLHGGKITAHVQVSDIVKAEVQQVERLPEAR